MSDRKVESNEQEQIFLSDIFLLRHICQAINFPAG